MKIAHQLAARLRLGCKLDKRDIDEAAAMLLQQAEQIEALKALVDNPRNTPFGKEAEKLADEWLAANGPGGWIDDLRNKCEALEIANAALKADAERYRFSREKFMCYREENNDDATRRHGSELVVYAAELHIDLPRVYSTYGGVHEYTVDPEVVDAAIDAMKGKALNHEP